MTSSPIRIPGSWLPGLVARSRERVLYISFPQTRVGSSSNLSAFRKVNTPVLEGQLPAYLGQESARHGVAGRAAAAWGRAVAGRLLSLHTAEAAVLVGILVESDFLRFSDQVFCAFPRYLGTTEVFQQGAVFLSRVT